MSFLAMPFRLTPRSPPHPGDPDRHVCILGAGPMGRRVAASWAAAGHNIRIRDRNTTRVAGAMQYLREEMWRHSPRDESYHERIRNCGKQTLVEAVPGAWLIIECASDDAENLDAKINFFNQVQRLAQSDVIMATDSLLYRLDDIVADARLNPEIAKRMLTIHYFAPPEIRLVELQAWQGTEDGVLAHVQLALEDCNMVPVVATKGHPGLVLSRVWAAIAREIATIRSQDVASQGTLDKAWTEAFIKSQTPPCALMDRQGLENLLAIERDYIANRGLQDTESADYLQRLIDQGRTGARSGQGGVYPPKGSELPAPFLYVVEFAAEGYTEGDEERAVKLLFGRANGAFPEGETYLGRFLVGAQGCDIAVSQLLEKLFWSITGLDSSGESTIVMTDLRGRHVQPLIPPGVVSAPSRVAVDEERGKLYFTDCGGLRVFGCNLDGSCLELLFRCPGWTDATPYMNRPSGDIAFSATFDLLYWIVRSPLAQNGGKIYWGPAESPQGYSPDTRADVDDYAGSLRDPLAIEVGEDGDVETIFWSEASVWENINSLNRTDTTCRTRVSLWDATGGLTCVAMDKRTPGREVYAADSYPRGGVYLLDMGSEETLQKHIYKADGTIVCFAIGTPLT